MNKNIPFIENFRLNDEQESHEEVVSKIYTNIVFRGTNLWVLVFAILIACLGLNINSTAVIIGAMLISPLMGPIMGLGMGLAVNDLTLLRRSAYNYLFAAGVGLATSTLYFVISPLNDAHSEILSRTSPNIYDVLIALMGGFAGILATSSKLKGNVLPGVAIATALMPPLCTAGYGLSELRADYFFGAFYLFLINTVFIALSTFITARIMKFPFLHLPDLKSEKRSKRIIYLITIVTIIPSVYFGYQLIRQNQFEHNANKFIENEAVFPNDFLLMKNIDPRKRHIVLTFGGQKISREDSSELIAKLGKYGLGDATMEIRQGFSYLSETDNAGKVSDFSNTISEKDHIIQYYQHQLDSIGNQKLLAGSIFKEIKITYPSIQTLTLAPAYENKDSSQRVVWMGIIESKPGLTSENHITIEKWLKVRMSKPNLRCVFLTVADSTER